MNEVFDILKANPDAKSFNLTESSPDAIPELLSEGQCIVMASLNRMEISVHPDSLRHLLIGVNAPVCNILNIGFRAETFPDDMGEGLLAGLLKPIHSARHVDINIRLNFDDDSAIEFTTDDVAVTFRIGGLDFKRTAMVKLLKASGALTMTMDISMDIYSQGREYEPIFSFLRSPGFFGNGSESGIGFPFPGMTKFGLYVKEEAELGTLAALIQMNSQQGSIDWKKDVEALREGRKIQLGGMLRLPHLPPVRECVGFELKPV